MKNIYGFINILIPIIVKINQVAMDILKKKSLYLVQIIYWKHNILFLFVNKLICN